MEVTRTLADEGRKSDRLAAWRRVPSVVTIEGWLDPSGFGLGLLERKILLDVLRVFGITVAVLSSLILGFGTLREVLPDGLPAWTVISLCPYVLPLALRFAIPPALLFTLHFVYGRLAADNEMVALKSVGISPLKVISPALLLAFLLCLPTFWLTELESSWGDKGLRQVLQSSLDQIVLGSLRSHHTYASGKFSLTVRGMQGDTLVKPTLSIQSQPDSAPVVIAAERAELFKHAESGAIGIKFQAGKISTPRDVTYTFPREFEASVPLPKGARRDFVKYSMSELFSECAKSAQRIKSLQARIAALTPEASVAVKSDKDSEDLKQEEKRLRMLQARPHRRVAHSFSCLAFAIFGIPSALRSRSGDFVYSFFLSFLPVLIVYYPIDLKLASSTSVPPYTVWLANAILVVYGLWLLRGTLRH